MYLATLLSDVWVETREAGGIAARDVACRRGSEPAPFDTVTLPTCFSGVKVLQSVKAMNACRIPV